MAARVRIQVNAPTIITVLITKEAVEDLRIMEGDRVKAVIKATEVMVSKEGE